MMRYEYRIRPLPTYTEDDTVMVDQAGLEALLNEQGAEEFELITMSPTGQYIVFQRDVFTERRSPEHIETVLAAVKSYDDVSSVHVDVLGESERGPLVSHKSGDEAWRFLIDRILGES